MGWFDGSSSTDDEDKECDDENDKSEEAIRITNETRHRHDNDDEEEEDPLDAYMKSLTKEEEASSSSKLSSRQPRPDRLDVLGEDEATSHWEEQQKHPGDDDHDHDDDHEDGTYATNTNTNSTARAAFQSTFHKAGETLAHRQVNITLEPVHHDQQTYRTFQRTFYATTDTSQGRSWRHDHAVTCHPSVDPIYTLQELRDLVGPSILQWCTSHGYTHPTLVQSQTFSVVLGGSNALITASTGSGKTLAYVLPMLVHVALNNHHRMDHSSSCKGLILCPTRELALQVIQVLQPLCKRIMVGEDDNNDDDDNNNNNNNDNNNKDATTNRLTHHSTTTCLAITGGAMGRYQLSQELQKVNPTIVVATPGRLLDVLSQQRKKGNGSSNSNSNGSGGGNSGGFQLADVTMVVLDEADKMLHMGFATQVTQILQGIRPDKQCIMTSATMGHKMETVAMQWLGIAPDMKRSFHHRSKQQQQQQQQQHHDKSYTRISIGQTGKASEHVQQHVMVLPSSKAKEEFMIQAIPTFVEVGRTIIFCATRQGVEELALVLRNALATTQGHIVLDTLHGDRHSTDRNAALKALKQGSIQLLIATDVAGRGLDIPLVATVINYDPAKNLDTHIHRIGRAGRLSGGEQQTGSAYTLLLRPQQADFAHVLLNSMERDGRYDDITPELRSLASLSKRSGNVEQRDKFHKSGLGYVESSSGPVESQKVGHYGPASSSSSSPQSSSISATTTTATTTALSSSSSSPRKSRWSHQDQQVSSTMTSSSSASSSTSRPLKKSRWG